MSFLQGAKSDYSSRSSIALAFPSNNTVGSLIIVFVSGANNSSIAIADSQLNSYTQLFLNAAIFGSTNTQVAWYALNAKAGANTVTVSWTTAEGSAMAIAEYGGVATSSALDQSGSNTGTVSPTWSTLSKTTAVPEIVIALVASSLGLGTAVYSNLAVREQMVSGGTTYAAIFDDGVVPAGTYQGTGPNGVPPSNSTFIAYITTFTLAAAAAVASGSQRIEC
jgi:hypothetical protein